MFSDEQMLAALNSPVSSAVQDGDGVALYIFAIDPSPHRYGIRVPLPSSDALKPWYYTTPTDAEDAANMLRTFVEEEIHTGCGDWGVWKERDGIRIFEVASYGIRTQDQDRHEMLLADAGPNGWHGRIREGGPPDSE